MRQLITLCIILIGALSNLNAQDFGDLDKSPMDAVIARNDNNSPLARIIYSRPQKKGREIFGELVPYGDVWRTGANEATEITFYENVMFNGKTVKAGTYSLFTIPEKEQWTIIVNSAINLWGAYNYDKSKNVLTTKVKSNRTAATVESFSITFRPTSEGANLLMGWDDTYVEVPITK